LEKKMLMNISLEERLQEQGRALPWKLSRLQTTDYYYAQEEKLIIPGFCYMEQEKRNYISGTYQGKNN
jgi:hypothetical protein